MRRVYVDGVFDMFHASHIEYLRRVRDEAGVPSEQVHLICGVVTDEDTASYKRVPVIPHDMRCTMLRHCDLVDEVITHPPLVLTGEFLDEHDIHLVFHGDDSLQEDFFAVAIARNIMRYVPYSRRISTTRILGEVQRRTAEGSLDRHLIQQRLRS
mgnify:CR=1 FL=1